LRYAATAGFRGDLSCARCCRTVVVVQRGECCGGVALQQELSVLQDNRILGSLGSRECSVCAIAFLGDVANIEQRRGEGERNQNGTRDRKGSIATRPVGEHSPRGVAPSCDTGAGLERLEIGRERASVAIAAAAVGI